VPEYPRLTAKEAENFFSVTVLFLIGKKVAIESLLKRFIGWFYPVMPEKYCTQKS